MGVNEIKNLWHDGPWPVKLMPYLEMEAPFALFPKKGKIRGAEFPVV